MLTVSNELTELIGQRIPDVVSDGVVADTGYVVEGVLGAGGMAVAFLVRVADDVHARPGQPAPGTRCVLKVLLPEIVVREAKVARLSFKKEVVALARLADKKPPSPFVVRWLDAGEMPAAFEGQAVRLPWCVLELVDGRPLGTTLEERLANTHGPLEPTRAAALIEGIVRGLRAIHAVGLVHRDLKPSNVLVCGEPPHEIPKITDFGVARAAGVGDTFDVSVGTSGYCALEQLEGKRPGGGDAIGPWSDVFALGAILYEILTRAEMFPAPNAMGYVGKVLARNYVRLAARGDLGPSWQTPHGEALARELDVVLDRATSPRSPGGSVIGNYVSLPMRHRDVDELLDELEPLLERVRELGRGVRPASVQRVADRHVHRWEWTVSEPAPVALDGAAVRSDGAVLAAGSARSGGKTLWFFDPSSGGRWSELPRRNAESPPLAVLHGGLGTFVVVRQDGEVEVLPGGGGAFSYRLPVPVRAVTALAGDPLGTAFLAVQSGGGVLGVGDSLVLRMRGRAASPFARLGRTRVSSLALADDVLIAAGSADDARGEEAFVAALDRLGQATAWPPLPGRTVHAIAWDADGGLLLAGPEGTATILRGARSLEDRPPAEVQAIVALPDGQVWGFAPGFAMRRNADGVYQIVHVDRALRERRVLALAASGARVWAVHDDGRVLMGRLALDASP